MGEKLLPFGKQVGNQSKSYVAFKAVESEVSYIKIRPRARAWERMAQSHLWRILEDGYGTEVGLVFSFACVVIKGRNLELLPDALGRGVCDTIQEFDPKIWDVAADTKAPFIEMIDIFTETREQIVHASDAMLKDIAKTRADNNH